MLHVHLIERFVERHFLVAMLARSQSFPKLESMIRSILIAIYLTGLGVLALSDTAVHAKQSDSLTAETWYKVGMGYLKEEKFLSAGDAFHQAYRLAGDPALLCCVTAKSADSLAKELERDPANIRVDAINDANERSTCGDLLLSGAVWKSTIILH